MVYPKSELNSKIFSDKIDKIPTRDGYGKGLVLAGEKNKNVVVLTADLADSTRAETFAKRFPERFFECGVAEQNMATVAAGLGVSGKIPFMSSYAVFSPGRNLEQIRTTIAYNDANVKIAGHHAGVSVGPDGATHQALEDIAIMRTLPNMRVVVPCDALEARKATEQAAEVYGPVYLRFSREKTPVFTSDKTPFTMGRAEVFFRAARPKCAIIACGPLVYNALVAASTLKKKRAPVMVLNCHTIKPLDKKAILKAARDCGSVVTVEEHQIFGGLGGAIAELLAESEPTPVEFVGMQDSFGESGAPDELIKKYGMSAKAIEAAVLRAIKRR